MLTENEVAFDIALAVLEWKRNKLTHAGLIRDIRNCIRRFDEQPTEYSTSEPVDLATLADGAA